VTSFALHGFSWQARSTRPQPTSSPSVTRISLGKCRCRSRSRCLSSYHEGHRYCDLNTHTIRFLLTLGQSHDTQLRGPASSPSAASCCREIKEQPAECTVTMLQMLVRDRLRIQVSNPTGHQLVPGMYIPQWPSLSNPHAMARFDTSDKGWNECIIDPHSECRTWDETTGFGTET
jgi:hypothetical protein